jgi:molecular chaperone DnaJ
VLTIEVEPHPVFRRDGADLHCSVPVGMVQAAMGGHVDVVTPDGTVTIEVPAGTQNGQRFRLRKRGVPRPEGGGRGDLWVEAQVVIPAVTDDKGRSLLRELMQSLPES